MFFIIDVLKNFVDFTGKHPLGVLFNKVAGVGLACIFINPLSASVALT